MEKINKDTFRKVLAEMDDDEEHAWHQIMLKQVAAGRLDAAVAEAVLSVGIRDMLQSVVRSIEST